VAAMFVLWGGAILKRRKREREMEKETPKILKNHPPKIRNNQKITSIPIGKKWNFLSDDKPNDANASNVSEQKNKYKILPIGSTQNDNFVAIYVCGLTLNESIDFPVCLWNNKRLGVFYSGTLDCVSRRQNMNMTCCECQSVTSYHRRILDQELQGAETDRFGFELSTVDGHGYWY
jgi:hypothetical protein